MTIDAQALARVWHLALSRAEDKHAAHNPHNQDDAADIAADGQALDAIADTIESLTGNRP